MGVFDFVRDVGAKVGIGKSSEEKEAEEAAKAVAEAKDEAAKRAAERRVAASKAAAAKAAEARKAAAKKRELAEKAADRKDAREKAVAAKRYEAYKKSIELERYVSDLGLPMRGIDIRYENGTAYIEGEATDQETKEKIILAVGNAEGIGRVEEEMTVAQPEEQAVFHTVASGDTLWGVAQKVYGDGNRYPEIFEANKPMLTDPDLIYPGQVLRCPK